MIPTAYQLLHDVATATESCDKLSKVEKSCVSCPPQLVKVIRLSIHWRLLRHCWSCDMNSTLGSVVPLAMFLYFLWQTRWCVGVIDTLKRHVMRSVISDRRNPQRFPNNIPIIVDVTRYFSSITSNLSLHYLFMYVRIKLNWILEHFQHSLLGLRLLMANCPLDSTTSETASV